MISFTPFCKEDLRSVVAGICPTALLEDTVSIMQDALSSDDGAEYAAAIVADCLLLRVCDYGRYYFIYPFMLTEGADTEAAVEAIVEYSVREELPLVIADVPAEELSELAVGFHNLDLDAEDIKCSSYRVTVKTPPMLLDEAPSHSVGELKLGPLTEADIPEYARLCKSPETCAYWGYDYREDAPEADDGYFYKSSVAELSRGISLTFAVRWCGRLVGEAVLYAFDGRGSAELALRIFPELWGRGIGKRTVRAMLAVAAKMGLSRLYARVHNENERSVRMFSDFSDKKSSLAAHTVFEIKTAEG